MADDRSDAGVRSVGLALGVLEAIAFSGEELGVTQLAERLNVTKGSVHRHLITLVERGYLVQNSLTARYSIGAKGRLLARLAPGTFNPTASTFIVCHRAPMYLTINA